MTLAERTAAIAALGFTDRQARFLVTVLLHSGVCLERQYCMFAGIQHGQKAHDFFAALIRRRMATAQTVGHRRTRLFHVHRRSLYAAIGEPHSRLRRPAPVPRAIERLMVLDAVLAHPDTTWLATERDKVTHFTHLLHTRVERAWWPQLRFGTGTATTTRYFPDRFPIGLPVGGGPHVFTYLVTRPAPVDFRAFLRRHSGLWGGLPSWTLRLLVPGHFGTAVRRYDMAWRDELASPLRLSTVEELQWYFAQRQQRMAGQPGDDEARYAQARDAFAAPRFRGLYRAWCRSGSAALTDVVSSVLSDAISRGTGRLETQFLTRPYLHLARLASTA